MSQLRRVIGHNGTAANRLSREAIERSALARNAALCAGIPPWVAAIAGVKAVPPQPHRWWVVFGKGGGKVCLRCSAFEAR